MSRQANTGFYQNVHSESKKKLSVNGWQKIIIGVIGFLLGRSWFWIDLFPFGPAFLLAVAYLHTGALPIATLMVAAGLFSIVAKAGWESIGIVLFLGFLLRYVVKRYHPAVVFVGVFLIIWLVKAEWWIAGLNSLFSLWTPFFESLLSVILALVFLQVGEAFERVRLNGGALEPEESVGLALLILGCLTGIGDWSWGTLSVAGVFMKSVILLFAYGGGARLGAVAGVVIGLASVKNGILLPSVIGIYALGGMLSGLLRIFGKFGTLAGLIAVDFFLAPAFSYENTFLVSLWETFLGGIIFFLLPQGLWVRLNALLGDVGGNTCEENRAAVVFRQCARVFSEIACAFEPLGKKPKVGQEGSVGSCIAERASEICKNCPVRRVCWERSPERTHENLLVTLGILEAGGDVTANHQLELRKNCPRFREWILALQQLRFQEEVAHYCQVRIKKGTNIVREQAVVVAELFEVLAEKFKTGDLKKPEKEKYRVEVGKYQLAKDESGISGDCLHVYCDQGHCALLLSDGMGTGPEAAVPSQTLIRLWDALFALNLTSNSLVPILNALLMLSTTREITASLDVVSIDLRTGEAEFIKNGAVPGFLRRDRKIEVIPSDGHPLGILEKVSSSTVRWVLEPGDFLVMISDGFLAGGKTPDQLFEAVRRMPVVDPQAAAVYLVNRFKKNVKELPDDLSVIVARIDLKPG